MEAGQLLVEAKGLVDHGQWASWLAEHVGFSERTARRYMQLTYAGLETTTVAVLGIRGAAEQVVRKKPLCPSYLDDVPENLWPLVRAAVAEGRQIRAAEAKRPGILRDVLGACVERRVPDMREALEDAIARTVADRSPADLK